MSGSGLPFDKRLSQPPTEPSQMRTPPSSPPNSPRAQPTRDRSEQLGTHRQRNSRRVEAEPVKSETPVKSKKPVKMEAKADRPTELIDQFVMWLKDPEDRGNGVRFLSEMTESKKVDLTKVKGQMLAKLDDLTSTELETALAKTRQIAHHEVRAALPLLMACVDRLAELEDQKQVVLEGSDRSERQSIEEGVKPAKATLKLPQLPKPKLRMPPSLNLSKLASKISQPNSPRLLKPSRTPRHEPAPTSTSTRTPGPQSLAASAPPAPKPDPEREARNEEAASALATFISQLTEGDTEGMEQSLHRLRPVKDALDSAIDAVLKGESGEKLKQIVDQIANVDSNLRLFKLVTHRLTGRIWADLLVNAVLNKGDRKMPYDALLNHLLSNDTEHPVFVTMDLFVRSLKDRGLEELLALRKEVFSPGYVWAGLEGAVNQHPLLADLRRQEEEELERKIANKKVLKKS
jgi:hypothetical protein